MLSNEWVAVIDVGGKKSNIYLFIASVLQYHIYQCHIIASCLASSQLSSIVRNIKKNQKEVGEFLRSKKKIFCIWVNDRSSATHQIERVTRHRMFQMGEFFFSFISKKKITSLNIDKKIHCCTLTLVVEGNISMHSF